MQNGRGSVGVSRVGSASAALLGLSPSICKVKRRITSYAPSDFDILILGETGTGKELVARAIHEASPRARGPFVPVNCGAIPEHLLDSELFGHERGAFTGAEQSRDGLIASAENGTLFLDEVDELLPAAQVKLLRVLQSRRYRPVGTTREVEANFRVIAASNRHLYELVSRDLFREDLYHRLNILRIEVPPLRERIEDVPLLTEHFLRQYSTGAIPRIRDAAIEQLLRARWSGNVRELEHAVIRALQTNGDIVIDEFDLDEMPATSVADGDSRGELIDLLRRHGGCLDTVAEAIGKSRRTVQRLLKKHGLGPHQRRQLLTHSGRAGAISR